MVSTFSREMMTIDRSMEFFTEDEIAKQIGYGRPYWAAALLKEMIDNGLDAAERGAAPPVIRVAVGPDSVAVTDNGGGIPPEVVTASFDYATRTTDKAGYVSPTRGRQGNALKTLWAAPYVVASAHGDPTRGFAVVDARGVRHRVAVKLDAVAARPEIVATRDEAAESDGTTICLTWPRLVDDLAPDRDGGYAEDPDYDILHNDDVGLTTDMRSAGVMVRAFALFNPHAAFTLERAGHPPIAHPARRPGWRKWLTHHASPPHWYTPDRLAALAAALLKNDIGAGGRPRSVREFVGAFKGLRGTQVQSKVYDAARLSAESLADLFPGRQPDLAAFGRLHAAMCAAAKAVPPENLGRIGKEAMLDGLKELFAGSGGGTDRYACRTGTTDGVPWVLEAALSLNQRNTADRMVVAGVNWSPALRIPFEGLADALQDGRVDHFDPITVAVHLAYPGATATDRGKSRYDLPPEIIQAAGELVGALSEKWRKLKAQADRTTQRVAKDKVDRLRRGEREEQRAIRDAAYQVMAEAYQKASGGLGLANARQVMYAARPLVQALTGGKSWKDSKYFTQTLLPDYLAENPVETRRWDVVFDDRGHFLEPHTGTRIGIGTLAVRNYLSGWEDGDADGLAEGVLLASAFRTAGPKNRFAYVLFLEKEGFHPLIERSRLCERYDVGLMSTKGMTVTAARRLIEELSAVGVTVLVLHDFDKSGLGILHTMRTSNRRYTFKAPPRVVDLGLRLPDVARLSLGSERVGYDEKDPRQRLAVYGATAEEQAFLVRERVGPKAWAGERVELNAMTADQFVSFIEGKFGEHGVRKVVPDAATLAAAYQRAARIAGVQRAIAKAVRAANKSHPAVPADLLARLEKRLAASPELPWDQALARIAGGA